MRFLVDEQLPVALARWISARGHDAQHVTDVGLGGMPDSALWDWAQSSSAAIVTKDEDFVLAASRMEQVFDEICEVLRAGERIVEIR